MTLSRLLDLQAHDNALRALRHDRENLPVIAELANTLEETKTVEGEKAVFQLQLDQLLSAQAEVEKEVSSIAEHRKKDKDRMYSGTVSAHKDLLAIQRELDLLKAKQSELEDQLLEMMETAEQISAEMLPFDQKLEEIDSRRESLRAEITIQQAEIDVKVDAVLEERLALIAEIAPEAFAEYERVAEQRGGIAAAALNGTTCMGCHMALPSMEIDRIRRIADSEIAYCECGCILIR